MKKGERIKHLAEAILIFYWMLCLLRADSYYAPYLLAALAGIYCRIVRCMKHTGAEDGMTKGERWLTRVCAAAFSLTVTVANYRLYSYFDGTKLENFGKIIVGITLLLGGYILFHEILCGLYRHTDAVTVKTAERKLTPWLWVGMWVLIVAVDCFVLFAAEYPGVLTPDSISQMTQLLSGVYSNHHPYYHTQIIRACILAGLALFDDLNAAVALYSVFSVMVMATCFVYTVATIDTVTGRRKITIAVFIWYLIMPFHIIYSISMWKDVFFGASMAGFVVSLYRCMNHIGRKTPNYIALGITGLCVCLLRSNGWIAFIASTVVFLILFRVEYRKILFLFVGILAASFILKHPVLKALNVTQPDTIEALSVPAQQIARVVADEKELTAEQEELLSQVIDVEQIAEKYDSTISDPIKILVRQKGNQEYITSHKGEFLRLYLQLFLKYPQTYIKAWADQTRGYWNAGYGYWRWETSLTENDLGLEQMVNSTRARGIFKLYLREWENNPLLQVFLSIGLHVWIVALACYHAIIKKNKIGAFIAVPFLAVIATLMIATPVYSEFRYAYSVFCGFPFVVAAAFFRPAAGKKEN